ncbi:sensor histidine kinase [Hymenobacter elongatus]|uniref:Histidine kinase n=1 Tax=Hymenobacter elongatus TaxID=877208 RepID=A0A4Z0PN50_9BACT|nr:histidine kinase [Hymenobacter elongatus]TGE15798.1 histidine kinase [Hymenobacter elongatus]
MPQPAAPAARTLPNDRWFLLIGIPTLAVLALLPRGLLHVRSLSEFLVAWALSTSFTTVFWLTGRALWAGLFRRFPLVGQTAPRLWSLAILNTLITFVVTVLIHLASAGKLYFPLSSSAFWFEFGLNMVPTLVVQLIYESWHSFQQWEHNVRRAEQLAQAGVQSQLEALQNQLDPHFLFNSLNTLAALIDDANAPAQQFVEQLADVYRYVLLSRGKATVSLREELAFVETYVALQKTRFRDNLRVSQQIPAALLDQRVAPLSVQLLVENALKHNVVSRQHPLEVGIMADAASGYLRVQNPFRPRAAGLGPSTGLGLQNTVHRYELLQATLPVRIEATEATFTVLLPLLPAAASAHKLEPGIQHSTT